MPQGAKGFPNLTDHDWLYGGSPEKIKESLVKETIVLCESIAANNYVTRKNLRTFLLARLCISLRWSRVCGRLSTSSTPPCTTRRVLDPHLRACGRAR